MRRVRCRISKRRERTKEAGKVLSLREEEEKVEEEEVEKEQHDV